MCFSSLWIDFVPPPQSNEASSSNVLEIVEVEGQEDNGEDKDKDEVLGEPHAENVDE
jgi:hypothetical protein